MLRTILFVCFGVGSGFVILSFLLGEFLGIFDFNIDSDLDLDTDFGMGVSPFKPTIIASFLSVFGGAGLLLVAKVDWWWAVPLAALLGMAVSFVLFRFIFVPLHRSQNTSAVEKQSLVGSKAKVTETIPQGKYGKITYHVNGNTYTAPAKAEDGGFISRNSDVEIIYIEKNTYFVKVMQ